MQTTQIEWDKERESEKLKECTRELKISIIWLYPVLYNENFLGRNHDEDGFCT